MHTIARLEARAARLSNDDLVEEFAEASVRYDRTLQPRVGNDEMRRALDEVVILRREIAARLDANSPPF